MILICVESLIKMGQSSGSDNTLAKSDNEARECVWSEEHDRIPLKQRLKMLLASKHLLDLGEAKTEEIASVSLPPIDIIVKKEDEHCDSQGFHFACFVGEGSAKRLSLEQSLVCGPYECNRQEIAENNCICSNQITGSEINTGFGAEKVGASDDTSLQHSMEVEVKTEIPDDFLDDLDHIVLKERQRMLLSRKLLELTKHIAEGNFLGLSSAVVEGMIQHNAGIGKEESHSGGRESSMEGNHSDDIPEGNASVLCKTIETGLSNGMITASSSTNPQCPALARRCQGTKPGNFANIHQNDWICSFKETSTEFESCGGKVFLSGNHNTALSTALPTFANVKSEPLNYNELQSPDKSAVGNSFADIAPVKSELESADESVGDKVDHMLLRERMKLMASREVPDSDVYGKFECSRKILPSTLDCRSIVSESGKPLRVKRPRKRRKTVTDSVETALEEDAPGLLQVLIDKGVLVDEIKLYGEIESSDVLDDSLTEESFTDLEAVISKLFSQRSSLLKFSSIRCTKGEKASYCLACLISLVEQARYLQFRKWPIEWGWCRDLQSFIFVFERHNRIVLERPEYGYATYFFELVDSLPTDWQIKRLITATKLTSCSRVTLIENRALMVGEDLTKDEARVLTEYGWVPNSGLGTMLNYCDRVVHDRKNERDSSEWRSKIGKLLVDGYNGGTIVSTDLPKKVVEYGVADSPQIKLEL